MMVTPGIRNLTLCALLVSVFLTTGAGSLAQDDPGCEGVDDYVRSVRTLQLAYDQATGEIDEGDVQEWSPEEFTMAIAAAMNLTSGLESVTPPAAAVDIHESLIASTSAWTELLEAISESGIFGALLVLDQFEELQTPIDETGLAFEIACNVAFVDHDDDGTPEIGLGGRATPEADGSPSASFPSGSFENPVPVGEPQDVGGGWQVTVASVAPDSTATILAGNTFNDPPEEGRQFFVAGVMVENTGSEPANFDGNFRLRAQGQTEIYRAFADRCGVVEDEWEEIEIAPGEQVTAAICWSVPTADVPFIRLFDVDAITEARVYFSLSAAGDSATPVASV